MYCKHCGSKNEENAVFCSACGKGVSEAEVKQDPESNSKASSIKKILGSVGAVAVFVVVFVVVRSLSYDATTSIIDGTQGNKTELTSEIMNQVAEDINKELPKMVDSETRLDSVYGEENTLGYKYTLVNTSLSEIDANILSANIRTRIVNSVCTTPDMAIYVKNKATINYNYYDKDGLFIDLISVNTEIDCSK